MSNTIAPFWSWPPQVIDATNPMGYTYMPAFATACGTLYMVYTLPFCNTCLTYSLGSDLLWKACTPITTNLLTNSQPALISLDESLYAFVPSITQNTEDKLSVYSLDPSSDNGWTHLCDYNTASGSGNITGVVYHDVVVLVQTIQGADTNVSTLNCITMSTKDIKNPTNWSTSTKINGLSSGCISMYIRKEDLDSNPDGSIRFMYFDLESLGPRELTLDMVAMAWYPSPISMPEGTGSFNTGFDSAESGIGAAASPDGMLVWANLQPDNDANKVAMFRYSVARGSEDWSQQFIFQVDPSYTFEVPLSMTYLYGDLIVAWPSLEAIRFSMQRPGGCFDLTCWMKAIDDSLLVSELSIPGTHASATSSDLTLFTSKNSVERRQNMNITQQLNAGIRFLHFIIGISGDSGSQTISLYTPRNVLINVEISTLIASLSKWLDGHSSEGIILFFSPLDPQQNPTAIIGALNTAISPYLSYFTPTSSAPTITMGQLRNKILLMHTIDQELNSQTSISAGISLGTSYPDTTKKQIVSFTTDSGIPFTVQDHAISNGSATEVETDINGKSALVVTMLEKTAETGSATGPLRLTIP
ncbi:phosphatidylinositol-specific phospholipase C [Fusarium tjaetaba]|uniref:Phosphatidylinositol-specific phospholipase C n=1 Tax=Fusarium tjaetaba TaxID=1567544 RepID=A0A8H5QWZ2_9HYPO|nr:phosphatidylinositol-specific phospholipase C [Fusarium tjaetaba]KAF5621336.1 phosphatidylinositol-specific phospholipase C [Fusarium tjaetaba]